MSNPTPPLLPLPDDGAGDGVPEREVDGEEILDEDANPDDVDSATADRIAAEGGDHEDAGA